MRIGGLNPHLIPRFNIDYNYKDFLSSLANIKSDLKIDRLNDIFNSGHIYFTNSGRTSLYVILKALNLPEHSNIGVSLYTCVSDFDAIIKAGHNPVFIDIDPDNYTMAPEDLSKKIDQIDAIVVVHALGRLADLDNILKIAGERPVIEDCAHALLSRYKGKLAGTIGTAGFFSFRTGKYISAGEGGMIVTNDLDLASKINLEIEHLPSFSTLEEIKHAFFTLIRSTLYHRPWFGLIALPFGKKVESKVDVMNKYSFKVGKIRQTDLYVLLRKFRDFDQKVNLNRSNSNFIMEQLKTLNIRLPFEVTGTFSNYFLFPVQFNNNTERENASKMLFENGFDSAKLFSMTPVIAKSRYGYDGNCLNTEHVADKVLVVPHYYTLNRNELIRLCGIIKNVVN